MISVWHLAWIVPLSVFVGILLTAVLAAGRDDREC